MSVEVDTRFLPLNRLDARLFVLGLHQEDLLEAYQKKQNDNEWALQRIAELEFELEELEEAPFV